MIIDKKKKKQLPYHNDLVWYFKVRSFKKSENNQTGFQKLNQQFKSQIYLNDYTD